jgi:hypothetical protein
MMSCTDAEGRESRLPTALSVRIAHIATLVRYSRFLAVSGRKYRFPVGDRGLVHVSHLIISPAARAALRARAPAQRVRDRMPYILAADAYVYRWETERRAEIEDVRSRALARRDELYL